VNGPLRAARVQPLPAEAPAHWLAAGADTSALHGVDVRIPGPGGMGFCLAPGNSVWLDDNAADRGWYVGHTPRSAAEFTRCGDLGERSCTDLPTVLTHGVGHRPGEEHEPGGVMQVTLEAGTRRTAGPATATDGLGAAPTLIAWGADAPWIDGFVIGTGKRR
jgi:hypothetical protein